MPHIAFGVYYCKVDAITVHIYFFFFLHSSMAHATCQEITTEQQTRDNIMKKRLKRVSYFQSLV